MPRQLLQRLFVYFFYDNDGQTAVYNGCYSGSVPQLNILRGHPVSAPTPVHVQVQVQSVGLRVQPLTPPCRQPHSVFGGFYLPFRRMGFVMSGAHVVPWLKIIPTQQVRDNKFVL